MMIAPRASRQGRSSSGALHLDCCARARSSSEERTGGLRRRSTPPGVCLGRQLSRPRQPTGKGRSADSSPGPEPPPLADELNGYTTTSDLTGAVPVLRCRDRLTGRCSDAGSALSVQLNYGRGRTAARRGREPPSLRRTVPPGLLEPAHLAGRGSRGIVVRRSNSLSA